MEDTNAVACLLCGTEYYYAGDFSRYCYECRAEAGADDNE